MKKQLFQNKIVVKKSNTHGYGVFADKKIKKGEMIEQCYMLITRGGDEGLEDYYFAAKRKYAVFLGFGCIYNHADKPNTDYNLNFKSRVATFKAKRDIKKGEELLISYGDDWFSSRGLAPVQDAKPPVKRKRRK
jgi:SET domain-containing protein